MKTIYAHVRHWHFWYGVYGFHAKSCNDEIALYSDVEKSMCLGYFELSTKTCLIYLLANELDAIEDKEHCNEINNFINSSSEDVVYSYIYPRNEADLSNQVEHFAPMNDKGHKPVYIDMWSKLSKHWDIKEIESSVKILAKDFLDMDIERVEFLEIPTYEETKSSYERDYAPYL